MATQILKIICVLVYVTIAIVNAAPSSKLPKGFIQCKKSDPELDECLKNGFQKALPHLVEGVPSLGLIKIDPLQIIKLEIFQDPGPVSINLTFNDLDVINLKSVKISKLHYDPDKYDLQFDATPQYLILEGNYGIAGKILNTSIAGHGKFNIRLDIKNVFTDIQLKQIVRNGTTYFDVENVSWKLIPSNMRIKMDNLFNGDKVLGDNANMFLNENWREILHELMPAIEQVFSAAFVQIGEQFLKRIPMNQILLD